MRVILRRGTDHRGSADVYVFDRFVERHAVAGDRRGERVEVDDDHVDHLYAVRFGGACVFRIGAPCEQAAVYARV